MGLWSNNESSGRKNPGKKGPEKKRPPKKRLGNKSPGINHNGKKFRKHGKGKEPGAGPYQG
jgi:hypothetical protein